MLKHLLSILICSSLVSHVIANESSPVPQSAWSGSLGLVSQYIFRGLTQTNGKPAMQGSIEYQHFTGLYIGGALSNISWYTQQNAGTFSAPAALSSPGNAGAPYVLNKSNSATVEFDIDAGFRKKMSKDWHFDLGLMHYAYPGSYNNLGAYKRPDTTEVYGAIGYQWLTAKYSKTVSAYNLGVNESKGASYFDVSMAAPIEQWDINLLAHIGYQLYLKDSNVGYWGTSGGDNSDYSYVDYKLGVTKDLFGMTIGLAWTYANTSDAAPDGQTTSYLNTYGKNIGGSRFMLSLNKNF